MDLPHTGMVQWQRHEIPCNRYYYNVFVYNFLFFIYLFRLLYVFVYLFNIFINYSYYCILFIHIILFRHLVRASFVLNS